MGSLKRIMEQKWGLARPKERLVEGATGLSIEGGGGSIESPWLDPPQKGLN